MHRQRSRHGYGRHEMSGGRRHSRGRHRVRRGDVRSAVLALLDDRPMHGYEMIQELEERTGGRWTPSAGSIYPTLQLLQAEGLVTAPEAEGRKVYSLTESGQEAVPERTEGRPWERGDEDSPRFEARKELFRLIGAAKQLAPADNHNHLNKEAEI